MNLRRVRLLLTVLFTAITAVAAIIFAVVALRAADQRIEREAESEARQLLSEAIVLDLAVNNSWYVVADDNYFEPQGETWIEPPLFTIARNTGGQYPTFTDIEQDGNWRIISQQVDDRGVVAVALDLGSFDDERSSWRWRVLLGVLAMVLAAAAAGWWLAGRALRPARQAMEQQRNFIADAAHELRTPLAIIQASASQSLSRQRENWEYQRSLSEIQVAAERAGSGVSSLLELARLEAGQLVPRLAPLRLDLLVEEVAAATRLDGVEIDSEADEPVIVNADYSLLRQALGNLAANAGARADRVTLRVRTNGAWALTEVVDDGPGFDPEVLPHIFARFGRGDEKGSTGLGLAIVKTVVEAHHGEVDAANRAEGGAAVTIRLKIAG